MFFRKRTQHRNRTAAIEVGRSTLSVAVGELAADGTVELRTQSVHWRDRATTLHSPQGRNELTVALQQLVSQHRLYEFPITLTLNGELCVTRVAAGDADAVRREVRQIEQRSELYLSLGHGPKTLGVNVRQVDARHRHALVTVINRKTLDTLTTVAADTGIELKVVEPSLLSLSRLVGYLKGDAANPSLIVNLGEAGVEVGISYKGQLLLDYRPAGKEIDGKGAGEILRAHHGRLERYCQRYVKFAEGSLQTVYLRGRSQQVDAACRQLAEGPIRPVVFDDLANLNPAWTFIGPPPNSRLAAALGACLPDLDASLDRDTPNLLTAGRAERPPSLLGASLRAAWPLAAACLLAIVCWVGLGFSGKKTAALEQRYAKLATQRTEVLKTQREIAERSWAIEQFRAVRKALTRPAWDQLTAEIGHCVPDQTWLDKVQVDEQGQMSLSGATLHEDEVFELVRWLGTIPELEGVAISGTREANLPSGRATLFDVSCRLVKPDDQERESHGK